jgi:hypothetical protein
VKHDPPTLPVAPWEVPDPATEISPPTASQSTTSSHVDKLVHRHIPKRASPAGDLIARTFMGRLNVSDLDYMAKAILQMCDENHELRERVRRLEERLDGNGQA